MPRVTNETIKVTYVEGIKGVQLQTNHDQFRKL